MLQYKNEILRKINLIILLPCVSVLAKGVD